MYSDNDIKIAGDRLFQKGFQITETEPEETLTKDQLNSAKLWGETVAEKFIKNIADSEIGKREFNSEMLSQRRILLSFAASIGFETIPESATLGGLAQKSFLDTIKKKDPKYYVTAEDNGAFSFYYLAYRRGNDVERRIGQTFAMLCSHDGDPIYQEIGEALYCWFLSVVKRGAEEAGVI